MMRKFVERNGGFFEYQFTKGVDPLGGCYDAQGEVKIDFRDFPVGSRVIFERLGECEIMEGNSYVDGCALRFYGGCCEERLHCLPSSRSDKKSVIARKVKIIKET
jgi:hypothetical protein